MKVKELIDELQKLDCDEKEVFIDWQDILRNYIPHGHNDYIDLDFGLTFIPIGVYMDNYANATSVIFIKVKLEAEVTIK